MLRLCAIGPAKGPVKFYILFGGETATIRDGEKIIFTINQDDLPAPGPHESVWVTLWKRGLEKAEHLGVRVQVLR